MAQSAKIVQHIRQNPTWCAHDTPVLPIDPNVASYFVVLYIGFSIFFFLLFFNHYHLGLGL